MRPLKRFLIFSLLMTCFASNAQDLRKTSNSVPDSLYFKNKGVYVAFHPLVVGTSVNTDNNYHFDLLSTRMLVNWRTKNHRKFAFLASIGTGSSKGSKPMNFYETGFLIGRQIKGRRNGFLDLNVGLAAIGRKAGRTRFHIGWGPWKPTLEEVREIHTIGIPIDLSVNTSRGVLGIGIGVCGNLNANQPYAAINLRLRFGSPIRREYYRMR